MHSGRQTQPSTPSPIIHYHYHYLPSHPQTTHTHPLINKAKSHTDIPSHLLISNGTGSESASSQRSWKQFVRKQYQSNIDPKKKTFHGTAREQAQQMLSQPYLVLNKPPYSSNSSSKVSFLNTESRLKTSTLTSSHIRKQYSPIFQANNKIFSEVHKSSLDQFTLNPENIRTNISRKRQEESTHIKISQQTKNESSKQNMTYKLALLEDQCAFLRSKFLEHYVRNHNDHRQH